MATICNWSSTTKILATLIMAKDIAVHAIDGLIERNASRQILLNVPTATHGFESDRAPGSAKSDVSTSIHQLDIEGIYSRYTLGRV
jgi:hypothetical protein